MGSGGRWLSAGSPLSRALLAALAVDAGRLVPVTTLVYRCWGEQPPERAARTLHSYVTGLRRLLEQTTAAAGVGARLVRGDGGYRLEMESAAVDLHLFRRLASQARDPELALPDRADLLRQALRLWHGEPLAGVPGQWAQASREAWHRERCEVAVRWASAQFDLGDPARLVGPLGELVSRYPLVEPLYAMLMRALHAAGRSAEALDLYASLQQRLAEQLGVDPGVDLQAVHTAILRGQRPQPQLPSVPSPLMPKAVRPELTELHQAILSGDSRLGAAIPPMPGEPEAPRQLPSPPQMFTGRAMELADLAEIHDASAVVITAIDGMAGVGKTALAVQAAHQMADRYPDGQLFLDLYGHAQGVAPIGPGEALERMLRTLGVAAGAIPADLDERAGLYRSRLADQRVLIVLDNAATEAQVTPLMPGAPGCLVLVTSRRRLSGLDHTHTLSLDTLPPADAVTLLRHCAGQGRLASQPPDLVAELVELCGRLPLAIRIAAARLRSHPTWDVAHLVQRLRDQQHRLVELAAGQRSVTAALDLSYQDLTADLQRAYRLLGLHFGADIDSYAVAALLDFTLPDAGRMLEQLLEAHLLQESVPNRHRFHDLTRAHAAHTASRDETEHGLRAALDRLLDHYRYTTATAMDAAYPYEREHRPQIAPTGTPSPALSDPAAALGWLDSELPNLLAAARYATEHNQPAHIMHLSTILHRHLRTRGRFDDAVTLHERALTTARATGSQEAELDALVGLGHIYRLQGRSDPATDHLRQALPLARTTGRQTAELDTLIGLGQIHRSQGRFEQATDHLQQALQLARATGNRNTEQTALTTLGHIHRQQNRYEQATDHYQQALQLALATGNRTGELQALASLGWVHRMQGRYELATDQYQQALELARATGNRNVEQNALAGLGDLHRLQGRYGQAADDLQQLLDLAQDSGSRNWQFEAWQALGRLQHAIGHPEAALTHHHQALAFASDMGQPDDQSRAHDGIAHAHHTLHQHEQARTHWQHALDILTRLGIDQADDETTAAAIRAHLGRPI
jgi:tetratricopeptide (TPR) repeat protein/DNA-binding SARP family transcriptional activator